MRITMIMILLIAILNIGMILILWGAFAGLRKANGVNSHSPLEKRIVSAASAY